MKKDIIEFKMDNPEEGMQTVPPPKPPPGEEPDN